MLEVHTQKLGEVTILHLKGRIAIGETHTLLNALISHSGLKAVLIDLAGVIGIDAHGFGVLLELREEAQSKGIDFRLMNVTGGVRQLLRITCLDAVFKFTDTEVLSELYL